jgi:hypothetical protein
MAVAVVMMAADMGTGADAADMNVHTENVGARGGRTEQGKSENRGE